MASPRVAFVAPLLAGCSLIYNPSNLPDPRLIDAALVDANACAVTIDGVAPSVIDEGQGVGGSLPALVVLHGNNLVNANLHVELKAAGGRTIPVTPVTEAVASADTTYLAFTVTVNVDDALASAVPLDVVVTQDCNATATLSGQLTLQGLTELTAATLPADVAQLQKKYSRVQLGSVTLHGTKPAEITAVSSIDAGQLNAGATRASGLASGESVAGPGGVSGAVAPGGGAGGGGQGGNFGGLGLGGGGGGGGAGYAGDGHAGTSGGGIGPGAGGGAGKPSGDDMLISPDDDRASAGGGGGTGNLLGLTTGGLGGGGGGSLLISAGGNVKIAGIVASGGAGENKGGSGGGGGGGGAGGTVLVSTMHGTLTVGEIRVAGGAKGTPNGGDGAPGRVRWDAPGGSAPSSPDAAPTRGPVITTSAARIVTEPTQTFMVLGTRNHGFTARVVDQDNVSHDVGRSVFDDSGVAPITATLHRGYNKICVTLDGGSAATIAERCTDLAYLP